MITLLALGLTFTGLWLIAMGRETWRLGQSGSWAAMAKAQAQRGQAAASIAGGAALIGVAVWLLA